MGLGSGIRRKNCTNIQLTWILKVLWLETHGVHCTILKPVFRIRSRIRIHRILMLLGLQDPEKIYSGSWGQKSKKAPDPDPQYCNLQINLVFCRSKRFCAFGTIICTSYFLLVFFVRIRIHGFIRLIDGSGFGFRWFSITVGIKVFLIIDAW